MQRERQPSNPQPKRTISPLESCLITGRLGSLSTSGSLSLQKIKGCEMTIEEMISKGNIRLHGDGNLEISSKISRAEIEEIKKAKPAILIELHRRVEIEIQKKQQAQKEYEENIRALRADEKMIELTWQQGSPLSGYTTYDDAALEILEELGLIHAVNGWGYLVRSSVVEALGKKFPCSVAVEYTRPEREKKQKKINDKKTERTKKLREARETGKPVLLSQWTEDCSDSREECNTDIVQEYALPDGNIEIKRNHTW